MLVKMYQINQEVNNQCLTKFISLSSCCVSTVFTCLCASEAHKKKSITSLLLPSRVNYNWLKENLQRGMCVECTKHIITLVFTALQTMSEQIKMSQLFIPQRTEQSKRPKMVGLTV